MRYHLADDFLFELVKDRANFLIDVRIIFSGEFFCEDFGNFGFNFIKCRLTC